MIVDLSSVTPAAEFEGEDAEDTALVREMLDEAENYLAAFEWCREILDKYVGLAVGGVVGVFLFRITPTTPDIPEQIWVVSGDVPPAYIAPNDDIRTAEEALDAYVGAMERWVQAAKEGKPVDDLIPVNVPPTKEWAEDLERRLRFLDREILGTTPQDKN